MDAIFAVIDPILLVVLCSVLCCGGAVVLAIFTILGGAFDLIGSLVELLIGVDPFGGCGCLLMPFACLLCGGVVYSLASILATCGTPDAVNLCRLF